MLANDIVRRCIHVLAHVHVCMYCTSDWLKLAVTERKEYTPAFSKFIQMHNMSTFDRCHLCKQCIN